MHMQGHGFLSLGGDILESAGKNYAQYFSVLTLDYVYKNRLC